MDKSSAPGYGGSKNLNMQHYSPQLKRREFSADELADIDRGQSRILPAIFQNYSTPVTDMMASPTASAAMHGIPAGLLGAAVGQHFGGGMGAAAGGLGAGGLAALLGYYTRKSKNEGLEELMRRLPAGATKRDLLADPAYQADLDRRAMLQAAAAAGRGNFARPKYAHVLETTLEPTMNQLSATRMYKVADELMNDRTMLGFKKTPSRLRYDAQLLEERGTPDALLAAEKLRAAAGNAPVTPESPYASVARGRREAARESRNVVSPQQAAQASSPFVHPAMYGLGGAGLGALVGSSLGKKKNKTQNALIGGVLGGGAGLLAHHLLNQPKQAALQTKEADFKAIVEKLMPYIQAAKTTGGNFLNSNMGKHVLGGGALGAGLGGLAGLVNPGEDEEGNQRSRFGAMLRGALGGGALGAGAGGALGYAAPNAVGDLARRMGYRGTSNTPLTPTTAASPALAAGLSGDKLMANPLYTGPNTAAMKARPDATYTPTDTAGIAARRAAEKALQDAKFQRLNDFIQGPDGRAQQTAAANQRSLEESVGVAGATPETLLMKQRDPEGFARLLEKTREQGVQEAVRSSPSHNIDASRMDLSQPKPFVSPTMGGLQ